MVQLEDVASAAEREVWLSRCSVASLGVCSVQWAAEKQRIQLDVPQQRFQAPIAYWLFGIGVGDMTKILYHDITNSISQ